MSSFWSDGFDPWTVIRIVESPRLPPTSWLVAGAMADGIKEIKPYTPLPVGTASRTALGMDFCAVTFVTSTSGVSPATVTVSWTPPICNSTFSVAVKLYGSSIPSRCNVLKLGGVNVTL